MSTKRTQRIGQIVEFIKQTIRHTGIPPTQKEMMSHLGINSYSTIQGILAEAERVGLIVAGANTHRSVRVTQSTEERIKEIEEELDVLRSTIVSMACHA